MNYLKVFEILILFTVITLQLCYTGEIHYQKFNYLKNIRGGHSGGYGKSSVYAEHHARPQRSAESDNSTIINEMKPISSTTQKNEIKIKGQKYTQNTTGEYKHEILFSNMAWRAEQGEFEDHDGVTVFVIRGVFQYYTKEGTYNTTFYIVDEFGYHNIEAPPPVTLDETGIVDFRPGEDCNNEKEGTYCTIDPKLLALLVG